MTFPIRPIQAPPPIDNICSRCTKKMGLGVYRLRDEPWKFVCKKCSKELRALEAKKLREMKYPEIEETPEPTAAENVDKCYSHVGLKQKCTRGTVGCIKHWDLAEVITRAASDRRRS